MLVKLFATLKILPSTFDFHIAWEILKGVCVFIHLITWSKTVPLLLKKTELVNTHILTKLS